MVMSMFRDDLIKSLLPDAPIWHAPQSANDWGPFRCEMKTGSGLVKYDAACRAIAAAKSVDEAKKNRDMEADAAEIRMRATRRLDQMRQAQKETVGLNKGTAGKGRPKKGGSANRRDTLHDAAGCALPSTMA
jgi:hypothetical protein